jgi:hypothetical protein
MSEVLLLEAQVAEQEGYSPDALQVRLEFSRTARFTNLGELSPRILSIGLNDDPQGSHTFMLKGGSQAEALRLPEHVLQAQLDRVRSLLDTMTWDTPHTKPRFPDPPAATATAEFDHWMRELARAGRELHRGLWTNVSAPMQDVLRKVRASSDDTIQIVRYATNFLFPWAAMYDFELQRPVVGGPEPDVCHGFTRLDATQTPYTCARCLAECLHPDKSQTFCVYGFWGIRHQVEQVLHTPFQKQDAITRLRPMRTKAVHVAVGLTEGMLDSLPDYLAGALPLDSVRAVTSRQELLDLLWSNADRPALLLLLGHYETKDIQLQPPGPRVSLPGADWLQPGDVTDMVQKRDKWTEPNPVVVLAACQSAAVDLGTLTNFLNAFADARASAVVGTEATIFEDLALRFAKEVTLAIVSKKHSLGKAILAFRRGLLNDFNPLGFVFTPYGAADLCPE